MWYLIALVWIAVMVVIVLRYTKKQRRRASERAQHMETMLVELTASAQADAAAFAAETAATAAIAKAAANPDFRKKPRLLPQPAAVLYYVFRAGLPDHEIFAGVALTEVLELAAGIHAGRREPLQRKLAEQRLDFVICTKQLEVVAAVIVRPQPPAGAANEKPFLDECLQAAGVRLVKIDPVSPPRHHQIHALIYG
ncbi:MAG: hypothetical protein JWN94_1257 [Betaproteobacteria bacterium]|nr:hypothetical protein [Betaproteobacteria bacterium]